jgi:predicted deacylase
MSDLTFVAADTAPSVFGVLRVNGVVLNLTGATVKFQMRLADDRRFTVNADAAIVTPTAGSVRYDWDAGDLATAGEYISRWQVTFGDGSIQHSEPENTITIDNE